MTIRNESPRLGNCAAINTHLHNINAIPEGKTVGDILPVFAGLEKNIHVGEQGKECAACRKPFSLVCKPHKAIKLYPCDAVIPVAFSYLVCGSCYGLHERGGAERDSFLAAVEAYHRGTLLEATQ